MHLVVGHVINDHLLNIDFVQLPYTTLHGARISHLLCGQRFLVAAVSLTTFCTSLLARAMACDGKEALNDPLGSGDPFVGLKIVE